jgi:site-specific DNA-methyltransferase (adenine-specific)
VIVQVKGGEKVSPAVVRDLVGTITREQAAMGVLIVLDPPSREMAKEALSAGVYESPLWGKAYPRLQILTIDDLLAEARVEMPPQHGTFKKAERVLPPAPYTPNIFGEP